jgi:cytochrome c6
MGFFERSYRVKGILRVVMVCGLAAWAGVAGAQDSGEAIYKQRCAMCHGADGAADTPAGKVFKAASYKDPAVMKTPDADLILVIKNGKNKMPAFGTMLTEEQIKSVLAYVHTLQK